MAEQPAGTVAVPAPMQGVLVEDGVFVSTDGHRLSKIETAAETANEALAQFVEFVAERFSGSVGYSLADSGVVRSTTHTTVQW